MAISRRSFATDFVDRSPQANDIHQSEIGHLTCPLFIFDEPSFVEHARHFCTEFGVHIALADRQARLQDEKSGIFSFAEASVGFKKTNFSFAKKCYVPKCVHSL